MSCAVLHLLEREAAPLKLYSRWLQVTDPYLTLFRGLVPPLLGAIDFTPLFGFLLLQQFASFLQIEDMQDDW